MNRVIAEREAPLREQIAVLQAEVVQLKAEVSRLKADSNRAVFNRFYTHGWCPICRRDVALRSEHDEKGFTLFLCSVCGEGFDWITRAAQGLIEQERQIQSLQTELTVETGALELMAGDFFIEMSEVWQRRHKSKENLLASYRDDARRAPAAEAPEPEPQAHVEPPHPERYQEGDLEKFLVHCRELRNNVTGDEPTEPVCSECGDTKKVARVYSHESPELPGLPASGEEPCPKCGDTKRVVVEARNPYAELDPDPQPLTGIPCSDCQGGKEE